MPSLSTIVRRALPLAACVLGAGAAVASADPVAPGPPTSLPAFSGAAATPHAIAPSVAPQNPFMARNPNSNIHDDTWMTDAYQRSGPLGKSLQTSSGAYSPSICGSLAFDKAGRIVSVCPSTVAAPQARIFDPRTLQVLATYDMPDAPTRPGRCRSRTSPAAATSSSTTRTASGAQPRPATCSSWPSATTATPW
jgi:hypothetical protein